MTYVHALNLSMALVILLVAGPAALAQEPVAPLAESPQVETIASPDTQAKAVDEPNSAEPAKPNSEDAVAEKLRQQLLGAWLMAPKGGQNESDDSRIGVQQKFFGLGHWIYTLSDPETGELVGSHGGTYTLKGDEYVETIKFAAFSTEEMIGESFKFKLTVDGDRLSQRGIGNSFNEDYIRLTAADDAPKD